MQVTFILVIYTLQYGSREDFELSMLVMKLHTTLSYMGTQK